MDTSERMAVFERRTKPVLRDDRGSNELIGFALLAILIVIGAVASLTNVGTNLKTKLGELATALQNAPGTTTTTTTPATN